MILSFKGKFPWGPPTNFIEKIIGGSKIHAIRADKHRRWELGRKIHMATGVRTKSYNCFSEKFCISTQSIEIKHIRCDFPKVKISIDGKIRFYRDGIIFNGTDFLELLAKMMSLILQMISYGGLIKAFLA